MTCAPVKRRDQKTPRRSGTRSSTSSTSKKTVRSGNVQSLTNFYSAVKNTSECGLPNVSWIVPNSKVSEHPPALVSNGQAYVTTLTNAIMRSPCWDSTAIFLFVG